MPVEYRDAPELRAMAEPIIQSHHPHLIGYPIRFAWRSEPRKVMNKIAFATAEIVKGRFAQFVMTDDEKAMEGQDNGAAMFWIEVAEPCWEEATENQRLAVLDHELLHCVIEDTDDGDHKMAIHTHDIEEFEAIISRHGIYREDYWSFALAMNQASDGVRPDLTP
jgi:hypothetical protein